LQTVNTAALPTPPVQTALLPSSPQWLSLGALVVLGHAWLLSGSWEFAAQTPPLPPGSFQTRSIAAQVAPAAPPKALPATRVAAETKAAPKPKRAAEPQPAQRSGQTDNNQAQAQNSSATPVATENLEQNQQTAPENTAQVAINSVANTDAINTPSAVQTAPQAPNSSKGPPAYVLGPVAVPPPQQLAYAASAVRDGRTYHANGELTWQHDGQRYQARLYTSLLFWAREFSSVGQMGSWGLEPERYGDKTNRRERAAHFERDSGRISFSNNRPGAQLESGAQDRLSTILQLASVLAGAPDKYPLGSSISLQMASTGEAQQVSFNLLGLETIELPQGAGQALKLTRSPRAGREYEEQLELWLLPERGYMPARIKFTQANGDYLDMVLR
jgi:hypothetical protein